MGSTFADPSVVTGDDVGVGRTKIGPSLNAQTRCFQKVKKAHLNGGESRVWVGKPMMQRRRVFWEDFLLKACELPAQEEEKWNCIHLAEDTLSILLEFEEEELLKRVHWRTMLESSILFHLPLPLSWSHIHKFTHPSA